MLGGHETTGKTVGSLLSTVSDMNLMTSLVDLWTLGVGQAPRFPGETPGRDQRDSDKSQGKR